MITSFTARASAYPLLNIGYVSSLFFMDNSERILGILLSSILRNISSGLLAACTATVLSQRSSIVYILLSLLTAITIRLFIYGPAHLYLSSLPFMLKLPHIQSIVWLDKSSCLSSQFIFTNTALYPILLNASVASSTSIPVGLPSEST